MKKYEFRVGELVKYVWNTPYTKGVATFDSHSRYREEYPTYLIIARRKKSYRENEYDIKAINDGGYRGNVLGRDIVSITMRKAIVDALKK